MEHMETSCIASAAGLAAKKWDEILGLETNRREKRYKLERGDKAHLPVTWDEELQEVPLASQHLAVYKKIIITRNIM